MALNWLKVPLLLIEFNLILKAAQKPETSECFLMLFFGTMVMLAGSYAGVPDSLEAGIDVIRLGTAGTWQTASRCIRPPFLH